MNVAEIQREVVSLPERQRADLAVFILDTLEIEHHKVSDEEAVRRRDEVLNGEVHPMTRTEFAAACGHPSDA